MNNSSDDRTPAENDDQDCSWNVDTFEKMMKNIPQEATTINLVILVHGLMGNALEMATIENYLKKHAASATIDDEPHHHHFIIHSVTCNQRSGFTYDGIAAGGQRLADEVNEILHGLRQREQQRRRRQDNYAQKKGTTVSLSLIGNSLGGLYSRYALGSIEFSASSSSASQENDEEAVLLEIIPKLFITTATPHLGISQNTYLPIPRMMEKLVATALQQTGKDLFRFDEESVLEQMTFDLKFIQPLLRFEHRISYANAYGTDFQVPVATAAFLEKDSGSKHFLCTYDDDARDDAYKNNTDEEDLFMMMKVEKEIEKTVDSSSGRPALVPCSSFSSSSSSSSTSMKSSVESSHPSSIHIQNHKNIVAMYQTRLNPNILFENRIEGDMNREEEKYISLSEMLDAMGWMKVFVDVRPSLNAFNLNNNTVLAADDEKILPLKKISTYSTLTSTTPTFPSPESTLSSNELLQKYGGRHGLTFPLGHMVMIANAKDSLSRWLTQGGKPIMDSLARTVVEYLLLSSLPSTTTNEDEVISDVIPIQKRVLRGNRKNEISPTSCP